MVKGAIYPGDIVYSDIPIHYHSDGFYFLFDRWNSGMGIDWTKLIIIDLIILAIIGGWLFSLRQRKSQD